MVFLVTIFVFCLASVSARPASFSKDFKVTWGNNHVNVMADNRVELKLDKESGAGFASKHEYMFGLVSMKIKLVAGDSAGTVTTFYMSSDSNNVRDELDFEFLGNRSGQPYTVQTNVFAQGQGNREQRVDLWFDPSSDFHKYSIFWNHYFILFSVYDIPIRVYKNNEAIGVPYPMNQSMAIFCSLWDGDKWATRGGLDKINWSKAPFMASYTDFEIDSCEFPGGSNCASNPNNWWEGSNHKNLSPHQASQYKWVRKHYMIYDYCTDGSRNRVPSPECNARI